jgi:hypothetical protein
MRDDRMYPGKASYPESLITVVKNVVGRAFVWLAREFLALCSQLTYYGLPVEVPGATRDRNARTSPSAITRDQHRREDSKLLNSRILGHSVLISPREQSHVG